MKKLLILLLFICITKVNAQIISLFAGGGNCGSYSCGDGYPATSANFWDVRGMAIDFTGNTFITDYYSGTIRKVNSAGIISTVIGGGSYFGDGGPANAAKLSEPIALAFDIHGNLFIADQNYCRIRKVNTAGIITTIAGNTNPVSNTPIGYGGDNGPAINATLNFPNGLALDANGNVYIADRSNYRIRKVDTAGVITTVAGTGNAGYSGDNGPAIAAKIYTNGGMAFDAIGNLYFTDSNQVRMINTAGIISTVVGTGAAGYNGDHIQAINAQLNNPQQLIFDAAGNLFIADDGNWRVRMVNTAGIITTVAGSGAQQGFPGNGGQATAALVNPYGLVFDAAGNLLVSGDGMIEVQKIAFCNSMLASYTLTPDVIPQTWDAYASFTPNVANAKWYWGDGSSSTGLYPSHTYVTPGKYNICVTAYTFCGDSLSYCQNDSVYRLANNSNNVLNNMVQVNVINSTPSITVQGTSSFCAGGSATLTASGSSANSYTWVTTGISNGVSVNSYTYSTGAPTASLVVTPTTTTTYTVKGADAIGDIGISIVTVTVNPTPTIHVNNNYLICPGGSATICPSGAVTYTWMPSNYTGSCLVTGVPISNYTIQGSYANGCVGTAFTNVQVVGSPTISINVPVSLCSQQCTTLTPSITSSTLINTYNWNFDDGTNSTVANPVHCYTTSGTPATTLTVIDANGCVSAATTSITVYPIPAITVVTPPPFCSGDIVPAPTINTVPSTGVNLTWATSNVVIGLAASGVGIPPAFQTSLDTTSIEISVITYTPELNGCFGSVANETITINPLPTVNYTLMQDAAPFTWDVYPYYSANVSAVSWYWGDGTSTLGFYPSHTYSATGRYNICATVFTNNNCSATTCQNDTIYRLAQQNNSINNNMLYVNVLQSITGINQLSTITNQVSIYPNPTNSSFTIETINLDKQTLQIFDVTGKLVLTQFVNGKTNIDATNLSVGVYNLNLISPTGVLNKKLVIVR